MDKLINAHRVDDTVTFVFGANPKKKHGKAYARYEAYCHCTSLKEYLDTAEHKYAMADLRYDEAHGFLALVKDGVRINPFTPPNAPTTEQSVKTKGKKTA